MGAASLPGGSGQVHCDGFDQAQMGVTGHQAHAGQASGDQVSEELVPRRSGLAGRHPYAQHFAMSVIVDSGGNQNRARDDASSFAYFHGQCVSGDEGERSGIVEGPMTELIHVLVQVGCHT